MKRSSAILLALACSLVPLDSRADTTVRVATTPIELGAQVFYAKDQGFFKRRGLDVDIQIIPSGAAITAAVAGNSLDIAQANLVTLGTAHERGLPFVVIAPAGLYSSEASTTSLVVAKSSSIKTGKDLEGKTVAINGLRNITQIGTSAWMDRNGGDVKKVRFVEMPFPQMAAALEAGRVDAAILPEPELSAATAGNVKIIGQPYTAIANQFLIGGWFTTYSWAKANPDVMKKFVEATIEGGVWANAHPVESAKVLEKYTKITVSPTMKRTVFAKRLDATDIQPLLDASFKYGSLPAALLAADLLTVK